MPVIGFFIFTWDSRTATVLKAKYPDDLEVSKDILMRIYQSHAYEEGGGFISLTIGSLNIASYFLEDRKYYFSLLLSIEEDPDMFEDALIDAAKEVMNSLKDDKYLSLLPSITQRIRIYPKLEYEQKLAMAYLDKEKRYIIERIVDEGSSTITELLGWLKDKLNKKFIDIDAIVSSLVKLGLVKTASVKVLTSDVVFLVGDFFITRIPAANSILQAKKFNLPNNVINEYLDEVKPFFKKYQPTIEDNQIICKAIIDPDAYKILKVLRMTPMTSRGIKKMKRKVGDLNNAIKKLWDAGLIRILKDKKGKEYYFLKSDIRIEKIFPLYLLNVIRRSYNNRLMANLVLIEHLNILKEIYLSDYHKKSSETYATEEVEFE
ncbi:MAG: hypothetical protein GF329_13975 [Candidatus Lokiarchaeota archaeon]|nr:hypothetical protein [Candidatus Lokiarchaeota archaeon]